MALNPLMIGTLKLPHGVLLAPMAGYTHPPFRAICHRYGAALTYTEVVNAAGLVYNSKPTWHLLETFAGEGPVAAHIYGNDPAIFADAAQRIEATGRFALIDINCGCPVRKIVKKGCGAALMESPAQIGRIVKAVVDAVSLPVTVKTRIGMRPALANGRHIAHEAADNGAAAITIHGRLASKGHQGEVDWHGIAAIAADLPIPVIGNGGIKSATDALAAMAHATLAGVMVARGAVGAPWLFRDILAASNGKPLPQPTTDERYAVIEEHLTGLIELKRREKLIRKHATLTPEDAAALAFKPHWHQYLKGMHHWGDIRAHINEIRTIPELLATTRHVFARDALADFHQDSQ
jgi:tRNA-dihydrouridine synthase B